MINYILPLVLTQEVLSEQPYSESFFMELFTMQNGKQHLLKKEIFDALVVPFIKKMIGENKSYDIRLIMLKTVSGYFGDVLALSKIDWFDSFLKEVGALNATFT